MGCFLGMIALCLALAVEIDKPWMYWTLAGIFCFLAMCVMTAQTLDDIGDGNP